MKNKFANTSASKVNPIITLKILTENKVKSTKEKNRRSHTMTHS